jgi:hypothetical protein
MAATGANPQTGKIGPHPSVYFVLLNRSPYLKEGKGLYGGLVAYNSITSKDLDYRVKDRKSYHNGLEGALSFKTGCYSCRQPYSGSARKY